MKKAVFAIIGLLVILGAALAYSALFVQKSHGTALGICVDNSGYSYVAASYRPFLALSRGEWLVLRKLDPTGRPLWTKRMPVSKAPAVRLTGTASKQFPTMALDSDGNINLVANQSPGYVPRVMKFGPDGSYQWAQVVDLDDDTSVASLLVNRDRVCVTPYHPGLRIFDVAGQPVTEVLSFSTAEDIASFSGMDGQDALLIWTKDSQLCWVNAEGRVVKSAPFNRYPDMAVGIGDGSGLYIWVADTKGQTLLRKTDASGKPVWDLPYIGQECFSLAADPDGNALVCFSNESKYSINLEKISLDGRSLWKKALPLKSSKQNVWVSSDREKNVFLAGEAIKQNGWVVQKYSPSGILMWQKSPFAMNPLEFWFAGRGDARAAKR